MGLKKWVRNMSEFGTIVGFEKNEAIVMTDSCSFIRVRKEDDMFYGQNLLLENDDIIGSKKTSMKYYILIAASIAAVFVLISYFKSFYTNDIYAYISIDINPSIELMVDKDYRIMDVSSKNEDANTLIKELRLRNLSIYDALENIVEKSKDQAFIKPNSKESFILICAALNKDSKEYRKDSVEAGNRLNILLSELKMNRAILESKSIRYQIIKVPESYRKKSAENNISMGRYLIFEKVREKGIKISIEELKSGSIIDILDKNKVELTAFNIYDGKELVNIPANSPDITPNAVITTEQTIPPTNTPDLKIGNTSTPLHQITVTSVETSNEPRISKKPGISTKLAEIGTKLEQLQKGTGLTAQYYDNLDFTGFKLARVDSSIDFDWGMNAPAPSVGADIFSVRWTGQIVPLYSETYTFYTNTDDGIRLWVDNKLLIDQWKVFYEGALEFSGAIDLEAGKKYNIKIEYFEDIKNASAKLLWASKSQAKEIVPQSQLYSADVPNPPAYTNGLRGMYFNDLSFSDLKLTRIDQFINFNWFTRAPIDELGKDNFTVRWTGKIDSRYSEDYTFYALVDGGVRLWINNTLIIDHWEADPKKREIELSGVINMKAGVKYDIKMEYFDNGAGATAKLLWSSRRQSRGLVPLNHLYPD